MIRFAQIFKETGVEPNEGYMTVGLGGSNLLAIHDANKVDLRYDRTRLDVHEVHRDQLARVSGVISDQFLKWGLVSEDSAKAYSFAMLGFLSSAVHSRLFLVSGKAPGSTPIEAVDGASRLKLSVVVLEAQVFSVALRFLQSLSATNTMTPATAYTPSDARWLINKLNWTFAPQANISFSLADADWTRVDRQFGDQFGDAAFKSSLVPLRNQHADLTVFFVGKRRGWHLLRRAGPPGRCRVHGHGRQ